MGREWVGMVSKGFFLARAGETMSATRLLVSKGCVDGWGWGRSSDQGSSAGTLKQTRNC